MREKFDGTPAARAQVAGGQHNRTVNLAADFDYVRGIHTFRTGTALDVSSVRSDDTSNYLGTYTFESLDAYLVGYSGTMTSPHFRQATAVAGMRKVQAGMNFNF